MTEICHANKSLDHLKNIRGSALAKSGMNNTYNDLKAFFKDSQEGKLFFDF